MGKTFLKKYNILVIKKFRDIETGVMHEIGERVELTDKSRVVKIISDRLGDIMGIYNLSNCENEASKRRGKKP